MNTSPKSSTQESLGLQTYINTTEYKRIATDVFLLWRDKKAFIKREPDPHNALLIALISTSSCYWDSYAETWRELCMRQMKASKQ